MSEIKNIENAISILKTAKLDSKTRTTVEESAKNLRVTQDVNREMLTGAMQFIQNALKNGELRIEEYEEMTK